MYKSSVCIYTDKEIPVLKHHANKTSGGMEAKLHAFLISALIGGKWSATTSDHSIFDVHWAGDQTNSKAHLYFGAKNQISARNQTPVQTGANHDFNLSLLQLNFPFVYT